MNPNGLQYDYSSFGGNASFTMLQSCRFTDSLKVIAPWVFTSFVHYLTLKTPDLKLKISSKYMLSIVSLLLGPIAESRM